MHAVTIGTRGSPLALYQAEEVKARLLAAHPGLDANAVTIKVIKTTGDRILDRHLMLAGGKGLFTREIEEALLKGEIDCAVHSCKDMPTKLPDGLELAAYLKREDPRDALISTVASDFKDLPQGAVLGTASLRRRAQALRLRPDLKVIVFRGSVQTRLEKLARGEAAASFLALAGLKRLGLAHQARAVLSMEDFLPAPAQGVIVVETRLQDGATKALLAPLHDEASYRAAEAERAFLSALDGSCRTPIAAYAQVTDDKIFLRAQLLSLDGQQAFYEQGDASVADGAYLGEEMGKRVRQNAGAVFFEKLYAEAQAMVS